MKCYYHPDATLQHQEVKYKDYTQPQINEELGVSKTRIQEQNLVADHFEYTITPDELRQIEDKIDMHVDHVSERMSS